MPLLVRFRRITQSPQLGDLARQLLPLVEEIRRDLDTHFLCLRSGCRPGRRRRRNLLIFHRRCEDDDDDDDVDFEEEEGAAQVDGHAASRLARHE